MMKLPTRILAIVLICSATSITALAEDGQTDPGHRTLDNTAFTVNLYSKLAEADGNIFFSPYSISSAMAMAYVGSRENTAAEIARALAFELSPEELPPAFKELNTAVQASARKGGHELTIANGLCITGGGDAMRDDYIAVLRDYFEAELFTGGVDAINAWVRDKTEGKIEKILEQLSPNSFCVLLNAIYFKGSWASRFESRKSRFEPFQTLTGTAVRVPLMYQRGQFKLLEKNDFQMLVMPYAGNTLSMVIILPRAADGLPSLEEMLSAQTLAEWLAEADQRRARSVDVYVPRFKLETSYDLVPPLQALGIKDAFRGGVADFRGIGLTKGELWIGQVQHKAFLEVNEEGSEAAAATAVEVVRRSARPLEPPQFRADRPFLFLIREHATNSILFMGRLAEPAR